MRDHRGNGLRRFAVHCLSLCILTVHTGLLAAGDDHDHPPGGKPSTGAPEAKPPTTSQPPLADRARDNAPDSPASRGYEGCPASPNALGSFANGEGYDFPALLGYFTNPACQPVQRQVAAAAIQGGVNFSAAPPFRLDIYKGAVLKNDLESARRTEMLLARTMPEVLRQNPLGSTELLPILGQLALLSPKAGKSALATLIEQELYAGDQMLRAGGARSAEAVASDLARTLVRLGAAESGIAAEVAESIEEKALLTQADSLGKIFRALGAAATVEASLVPTFNLTAGALNRGVQRGKDILVPSDRNAMTSTVFNAIQVALAGNEAFEAGATELNDAMSALMRGSSLQLSSLKKLWKQVVRALAGSTSQTALAQAVALSLTPQLIFLMPEDMSRLLQAARNYPEIAGSIQTNFLLAWSKMWTDLHDNRIRVRTFNKMKDKYFEPLVVEILELDPYLIDTYWLKEVYRRGLVQDGEVEKRFPRLVLAHLERRDKAGRASGEPGLEPTLSTMAENFAVLWALSNVHVPALMRWVRKYDQ